MQHHVVMLRGRNEGFPGAGDLQVEQTGDDHWADGYQPFQLTFRSRPADRMAAERGELDLENQTLIADGNRTDWSSA